MARFFFSFPVVIDGLDHLQQKKNEESCAYNNDIYFVLFLCFCMPYTRLSTTTPTQKSVRPSTHFLRCSRQFLAHTSHQSAANVYQLSWEFVLTEYFSRVNFLQPGGAGVAAGPSWSFFFFF